jgi:hypothetical protein
VYVQVTPSEVTLEDPSNLKQFHVSVRGGAVDVGAALVSSGFGRMDGNDAMISVQAVRRAAAGRVADEWATSFESMLDFARTKGWMSDDGRSIRAHVERASAN